MVNNWSYSQYRERAMPSEKRKARKQNYFKAAKQSRKVQEVRIKIMQCTGT